MEGAEMTGLEMLVESNINEIADGMAWIMLGKYQSTRGYRKWQMICVYTDTAEQIEFGDMRRLLNDDKNAILFNGYENAWVGVDGVGGTDVDIKDIAKRLKRAYDTGFCKATHDEIDALMPKELYDEMMKEIEETHNYLLNHGYTPEQIEKLA